MPPKKAGLNFWSRETISALIEVYKANPCLYDVRSPDYFNREKNRDALETMVKVIEKFHPGVTDDDCKKKYQNLRTQFGKERIKEENSRRSGASTDEIYSSPWWCYEDLMFLRDSVQHKKGKYYGVGQQIIEKSSTPSVRETRRESYDEEEDMTVEYLDEDEAEISLHSRQLVSREEERAVPPGSLETEREQPEARSHSPEPGPSCSTAKPSRAATLVPSSRKRPASPRMTKTTSIGEGNVEVGSSKKRPASPKEKTKSISKGEGSVEVLASTLTNYLSNRQHSRDRFDIFGEFVASRLRNLTKNRLRKKAEHEIVLLILKYKNYDSEDSE